MPDIEKTIREHAWTFGQDDDDVQTFHEDLVIFLNKRIERIKRIEQLHGKVFHLPYFTKVPK